jgi:RNA polymerase sigma-70 factor (ECF subfamily)
MEPTQPVEPTDGASDARQFATTHWSVVRLAGGAGSEAAASALARLCETYWYPLYAYARRAGLGAQDAEDRTQSFFEHFLRHNLAARADRARGRFRSFLLASFQHHLADRHDRDTALKRGGGAPVLSFDAEWGEERYRLEPVDLADPQHQYELSWAMTILDTVLARLEQELAATGRAGLFEALRGHLLAADDGDTYAQIAARLGMTESAVKGTVHRMRLRYRALFREEIGHTVSSREELDAELRHLLQIISR